MRNSLIRISIGLGVTAVVAALWIIPSQAQVPATLAQPGMSPARVSISNRRDEPVPVTLIGDARVPMPVTVQGVTAVSVNGLVDAKAAKQSWEYRSVSASDQDPAAALNALGAEGWEAIGMTPQPGRLVTVLLKRPK